MRQHDQSAAAIADLPVTSYLASANGSDGSFIRTAMHSGLIQAMFSCAAVSAGWWAGAVRGAGAAGRVGGGGGIIGPTGLTSACPLGPTAPALLSLARSVPRQTSAPDRHLDSVLFQIKRAKFRQG